MKRYIAVLFSMFAATAGFAGPKISKPKILVILSASHFVSTVEGNKHPTGYFLSELSGPTEALKKSGYELVIATPGGKTPAMDVSSDNAKWFKNKAAYQEAKTFVTGLQGINTPRNLDRINNHDLAGFAGVFVPGGHAPIEDLSHSAAVGRILNYFHDTHKPTGLICHGPAALLSAIGPNGFTYKGYKMTGFTAAEEQQEEKAGHLDGHMPFYLDRALEKLGGILEVGAPWTSKAVRDRELITGQNPMSEGDFTAAYLAALVESRLAPMTP